MIKRLSIVTILYLYSMTTIGQRLTIKEMLEAGKCKDNTCFSEFIAKKGFNYLSSENNSNGKIYSYHSDKKIPITTVDGAKARSSASYVKEANGLVRIGFATPDKYQYLLIIAELKRLSYKVARTLDRDKHTISKDYLSTSLPKTQISVTVSSIDEKGKESFTFYDIEVITRP